MSFGVAIPSSAIRKHSRTCAASARDVMKPRASRQTTVSFPIRRESSSTAATVSSEVSSARTISISFIRGGGLNQCIPATRSLRFVAEASSAIESSEVLERSRAFAGAASSSRRKTSSLSARSSGTASMTACASLTASAGSVVVAIRESAPAACVLGERPGLHEARETLLDRDEGLLEDGGRNVGEIDPEPRGRRDLGDAAPHRPGADDRDQTGFDRFFHDGPGC